MTTTPFANPRARVVPRAGDASADRRTPRARSLASAVSSDIPVCILALMTRRRDERWPRGESLARTRAARGAERKNAGWPAASDRSVGEVIVEVIDQPRAEVSARPGSSCSDGAVSHRSTEPAVDHRARYTYRAGEDTRAGTRACIQGGRELRHQRGFPSSFRFDSSGASSPPRTLRASTSTGERGVSELSGAPFLEPDERFVLVHPLYERAGRREREVRTSKIMRPLFMRS